MNEWCHLNAFSTLVIQVQSSWYFIISWLIYLLSCKCWLYIRVQQSWNTKPLYYACLFHALLRNASCQYMPLLNLHPLIFGLTPFCWLCSVMLILYFGWNIFDSQFLFGGMQVGFERRAGCMSFYHV
jgi:hypothetical protein